MKHKKPSLRLSSRAWTINRNVKGVKVKVKQLNRVKIRVSRPRARQEVQLQFLAG